MRMEHIMFELPSVQQCVRRVGVDLADLRSALLIVPAGIDCQAIRDRLSEHFIPAELGQRWLSLSDAGERSPGAVVGDALKLRSLPDDAPVTASMLIEGLRLTDHLPDILHLEGFERLSATAKRSWLGFLETWAGVSQSLTDDLGWAVTVCLIAPATEIDSQLPETAAHLAVHQWQGFPSVLELQVACRVLEMEGHSPASRWREQILPSLSGGDLAVIDVLWESIGDDPPRIYDCLRAYGRDLGWDGNKIELADTLCRAPGIGATEADLVQESAWKILWASGMASHTPEYGWEIHPAVLALLGRDDDLNHRLWRGQARLILPLVERARLTLCDNLTQVHGKDWPLRWEEPLDLRQREAVEKSPRACEWGHLNHLTRAFARALALDAPEQQNMVSLCHRIRNRLAHYEIVSYQEFESLWNATGNGGNRLPRLSHKRFGLPIG